MTRKLDIDKYRQLLVDEKAVLEAQVKRSLKRAGAEDQSDEFSELSDYDNHPADSGSETFEREKELAIDENTEMLIDSIDRALEKIDAGTYGVCDRCGNEINKARLEALPYATYCIECQDIVEGR